MPSLYKEWQRRSLGNEVRGNGGQIMQVLLCCFKDFGIYSEMKSHWEILGTDITLCDLRKIIRITGCFDEKGLKQDRIKVGKPVTKLWKKSS